MTSAITTLSPVPDNSTSGDHALREDSKSEAKPRTQRKFRKLDLKLSTEQHYAIPPHSKPHFYGAYGVVRKMLDYSYHSHYCKERQFVHDGIVEEYLEGSADAGSKNWLILTVGVQGAGKQHAIRELIESGHLPITSYVRVDQDDLQRCLPEYDWYLEQTPDVVEEITRKEAGYIAETLCLAALRNGRTVVWDCALCDVDWYISRLQQLRCWYSTLRIALMYITATPDEVQERCSAEKCHTGRMISSSCISDVLSTLPERVERIKADFDFNFSCHIRNEDSVLEIDGDQDLQVFSCGDSPCLNRQIPREVSSLLEDPFLNDASSMGRLSFRVSQVVAGEDRKLMRKRSSQRRRVSRFQTSEENHKANHMNFYGRFAYIRQTLDYGYHSNYTFERQRFQDAIILDFLESAFIRDKDGEICTTPTEPWLCFTAGPMGAGKSWTMRKLVEKGRFPLLAFVVVDPDEIRRKLPEYHLYVSTQPELAGEMTRKESGYIAEILTLAGLESGKNVLVDGSLRDAAWYERYFERLRADFPVVRLAIVQISAPRAAVFQRAENRAKTTGRVVPRHVLEEALEQVPRSVKALSHLVDYHVELYNAPDADDITIVTSDQTWDTFQSMWIQTCAWIPGQKTQNKLLNKESSSLSRPEESSVIESST